MLNSERETQRTLGLIEKLMESPVISKYVLSIFVILYINICINSHQELKNLIIYL